MGQLGKFVFDVVDASVSNVLEQVRLNLPKGSTLIPFYPVSNPIPALIDVVIKAAAGQRSSIGVLRLWGHGSKGIATLVSDDAGRAGFSLGEMLDDLTLGTLPRLKPYFAPGARVEFKHCRVAAPEGWDWLAYLADQWGVEIHASKSLQHELRWAGDVYSVRAGRAPERLVRGIDP